jgi:hypothetical protein
MIVAIVLPWLRLVGVSVSMHVFVSLALDNTGRVALSTDVRYNLRDQWDQWDDHSSAGRS